MRQFLEKILPSQGIFCLVTIDVSKIVQQSFYTTKQELHHAIKEALQSELRLNIYVAPNSFKDHRRSSESAGYSKSFYVDLDVGYSKPYASAEEARSDLKNFVASVGLPDPVEVSSGVGIHAYWPFDADIPIEEWRPYAALFKKFCIEHGLKIDAVVTADAARIMRCPGTLNYKTEKPSPASVLSDEIPEYSFAEFKEFLGEPVVDQREILASIPKGLDDETLALKREDNFQTRFDDLARKSLGMEPGKTGCAQIKYVLENSETVLYPLWFATLSIAARCDDAETAVHQLSEDHPGYDRDETDRKAAETLKATGPHLCAAFDEINPGFCGACPHKGKLKPQSPIALARSLKEVPASQLPSQSLALVTSGISSFSLAPGEPFPQFIYPYQRGVNGGVYIVEKSDDPEEPDEITMIVPYDLYPVDQIHSDSGGYHMLMQYHTPHEGVHEFLLRPQEIYSVPDLMKAVAPHGVVPAPAMVKHLISYLLLWSNYMIGIKAAREMRMQQGFTEDNGAFVIGDREIRPDGQEYPCAPSPFIRGISKYMKPTGSYDTWRAAADDLNEPGMELHAFGMFCGFGSPLMNRTSTPGVSVSYYGVTGAAKTGALYAGLSLFGSPSGLNIFRATDNAAGQRMLSLHNIMFGRDEATNMDSMELSNLIHNISNGKSKVRMQSSVNAEREIELSSSLIGFFTSNHSLHERLQIKKASPEGEMARLIEFFLGEKPALIADDPARAKKIFDGFRQNYGHAGPMYIKELYRLGFHAVDTLIIKWEGNFLTAFGTDSAYRYYGNLIAVTFAGAEIAHNAGIVKFDLDRIFDVVMKHVRSMKDAVHLNVLDPGTIISEYINSNIQNFLTLNREVVVGEPRGPLAGRIEIDTGVQYITKKDLRQFLTRANVSSREFEHNATRAGLLVESRKLRMSVGWKAGLVSPPVWAYGFKIPDVNDLLPKLTAGK